MVWFLEVCQSSQPPSSSAPLRWQAELGGDSNVSAHGVPLLVLCGRVNEHHGSWTGRHGEEALIFERGTLLESDRVSPMA